MIYHIGNYTEGVLFENFDSLITNPPYEPVCNKDIRLDVIRGTISPYLLGDYDLEGELYLPKSRAVNITLPEKLVSFEDARTCSDYSAGVHHFMYDYRICSVYTNPLPHIKLYRHFSCTLGVDYSVFNEVEMIPVSLMNIIKNRYLTCAFQLNGIQAIPTFSFGHPALERWWYDGIPEDSQVAICNVIIGKTQGERELRQYAIEGLVRHKHPTTLIVYGRPLTFNPGVEVKFYEGKLSQIKSKTRL